jgi:hypothetical protein
LALLSTVCCHYCIRKTTIMTRLGPKRGIWALRIFLQQPIASGKCHASSRRFKQGCGAPRVRGTRYSSFDATEERIRMCRTVFYLFLFPQLPFLFRRWLVRSWQNRIKPVYEVADGASTVRGTKYPCSRFFSNSLNHVRFADC